MKKVFFLNTLVFLITLLCNLNISAYDFEVEGIYYNVTSNNTVEVTHKEHFDLSYNNSYIGEVVIPSHVIFNSVDYTVSAIGDSAFYGCGYKLVKVTLPESVSYIGQDAFTGAAFSLVLTIQSVTPPIINGSFDCHDSYPYYYSTINAESDEYDYQGNKHDDFIVLLVPSAGYQSYKELNDKNHYFNWVYSYDWEKTEMPLITINTEYYNNNYGSGYRIPEIKISLAPNEESRVFLRIDQKPGIWWQKGGWIEDSVKYLDYGFSKEIYYAYGVYAVAEGKLPSDLIEGSAGGQAPPFIYYDFEDSGIAYSYCNDSSIVVSKGKSEVINGYDGSSFYRFDYCGDVIIPSFVNGYKVIGIEDEAFMDCSHLTSLTLPSSISGVGSRVLNGCTSLKKLVTPVSISAGLDCNAESVYLIGEGDRNIEDYYSNSLSEVLKYLYIGGGVTGIKGMRVNPDTIYCIAPTPPVCDENTFTGYGAELHVPASSLAAYFTAPYWRNFTNIIGDATGIQSVSINVDSINLQPDMVQTLYATLQHANVTSENIFWYSTNNKVARVYDGRVTAIAEGECDIIAECLDQQAICHVTVSVLLSEITLDKEIIEIGVGSQQTLSAIVLPLNTTDKTVTWSSTSNEIATVNNGVVSAVKAGECDIIARCQNLQALCHVIVFEIPPTSILLNIENEQVRLGSQLTLTATILPENSTCKTVLWTTSNANIASVDSNGVVTAVGVGECDIVASCGDVQAVCHLVVVNSFISLDQHEAMVLPNHIITLTPTISPVTTDLVVISTNPVVAAARMAGNKIQVVGVSEGKATIVVNSADGYAITDSCLVNVYTERGDVNGDGFINIADVSAMIDYLLGDDITAINRINADSNASGDVTIADVSMLIDYLLGSAILPSKEDEQYDVNMNESFVNGFRSKMLLIEDGIFIMGVTKEKM